MLLYPPDVIKVLIDLVKGNKSAKVWLERNNFPELVQLNDAVSRYAKALEYLLVHKHITLAAFVNAVWEDKQAFHLLMENKEFNWAAMADYINGNDKAADFLKKNKLENYAELADEMLKKIRKEGDENIGFFNSGPYKA